MKKRVVPIRAIAALASALLAFPAIAQEDTPEEYWRPAPSGSAQIAADDGSGWTARASLGFTLSPATMLMAIEAPYMLNPNFGVGPLVQFGVSSDWLIIAPTVNLRYQLTPGGSRFRPLIQGGIGFAYLERDLRFGDVDDTAFLLNLGFGFDYELSDRMSLGSNLLFDILPTDPLDQSFIFSWQFLSLRYRF